MCVYIGTQAMQLVWRFIHATYATSNLELAASRFLKEANNWLWFGIELAAATAATLAAAAAGTYVTYMIYAAAWLENMWHYMQQQQHEAIYASQSRQVVNYMSNGEWST